MISKEFGEKEGRSDPQLILYSDYAKLAGKKQAVTAI